MYINRYYRQLSETRISEVLVYRVRNFNLIVVGLPMNAEKYELISHKAIKTVFDKKTQELKPVENFFYIDPDKTGNNRKLPISTLNEAPKDALPSTPIRKDQEQSLIVITPSGIFTNLRLTLTAGFAKHLQRQAWGIVRDVNPNDYDDLDATTMSIRYHCSGTAD